MKLTGMRDHDRLVVEIPEDFVLMVATRDRRTEDGAGYVHSVGERGRLRVSYWVDAKPEAFFINHIPITENKRMDLWRNVCACRVLEDGAERISPRVQMGAWLSVTGFGQTRYVELEPDGSVRGWPVIADLDGVVPPVVWRQLAVRRRYLLAEVRQASAAELAAAHADLLENTQVIRELYGDAGRGGPR